MEVKYKLVEPGAVPPFRKRNTDAGIDLCVEQAGLLMPGETRKFSTGLALEIPPSHFGDIRARSSTTLMGLGVAGVVDSSYRGIVYVLVTNLSAEAVKVERGQRLAQCLILPVPEVELVEVDELSETDRGGAGLGSSGRF